MESRDRNDTTDDGRYSVPKDDIGVDKTTLSEDPNDSRRFFFVLSRVRMADKCGVGFVKLVGVVALNVILARCLKSGYHTYDGDKENLVGMPYFVKVE